MYKIYLSVQENKSKPGYCKDSAKPLKFKEGIYVEKYLVLLLDD
jgi:hypothetical protein